MNTGWEKTFDEQFTIDATEITSKPKRRLSGSPEKAKEFIGSLLKEQREGCAEAYLSQFLPGAEENNNYIMNIKNKILNAPLRSGEPDSTKKITERMKLYKLILAYSYNNEKHFTFIIVAKDIKQAEDLAIETFKKYGYGYCRLHNIEVIAEEGQYASPNILLISDETPPLP